MRGQGRSGPERHRGAGIVRIAAGVGVVAASGVMLSAAIRRHPPPSAAIRRVARGAALLFAGAVVFVVGGYLILSGLWRLIRSRRRESDA